MFQIFRDHWPNYLIEAWGLGTFMVSAGVFATLLYAENSPLSFPHPLLRDLVMGLGMGGTAIAIIYSPWGKRSGAHINPAVTLTFFHLNKIAAWDAFFYILFQFIGALAGVLLVAVALGSPFQEAPVNYVVTVPGQWGWPAALVAEFTISFVLMTMVLWVSNTPQIARLTGLFSGILVTLYVVFSAPISGFGMNPARTFGSALPAQTWTAFWIYYFAPPLAMLLAADLYQRITKMRSHSICSKLCPNGETPCISPICCSACDQVIRPWRQKEKVDAIS
ncbi:Propanediol diffusion facilitator [Acaryochloris thomasi RCC1774]|uniref:Propanediol diffusion facilitator n=1 Tax=Acaryochloris thomasi RCC1774 TaxID=1764569 RepID=A0A2W1JPQ4_9CYAN|nr:aquaporin [Acaryochloris thomasi]PZD75226.1 Propanediol diffusion facilitator [Acaryochloris thomasi RCC1774]